MKAHIRVAITMGDPSGIGPEIVAQALASPQVNQICQPLVIGDYGVMCQAVEICGLTVPVRRADPITWRAAPGISVLDLANVDLGQLRKGKLQASSGRAAYEYLQKAVQLACQGYVKAIVTAPLHKGALRAAGIGQEGHTEILAALTRCHDPLTMFEVDNLRVFFLSRHVSLRQACALVQRERLLSYIPRCFQALEFLGICHKALAVAALNPHGSDGGLFGTEEQEEIIPAISALQARGYNVIGPIAADAIFHLARSQDWGAVLALYHDQGHIATKMLDFDGTISMTLGLPFLRTAVDHGTAFDIAGQGKARASSLLMALHKASYYAQFWPPNHSTPSWPES